MQEEVFPREVDDQKDPSSAKLARLLKELQFHNETNKITYTYCNIMRRWEPWFHPRSKFKNGSSNFRSPASFKNIQYSPPQCPHSQNVYRETKDTAMVLSESRTGWQFQCKSHLCPFIVKIAPWNDKLIVSEAQYNLYLEDLHREDLYRKDEDEDSNTDHDSLDEVASLLMSSSQTSTSSSNAIPAGVPLITRNHPFLLEKDELQQRDFRNLTGGPNEQNGTPSRISRLSVWIIINSLVYSTPAAMATSQPTLPMAGGLVITYHHHLGEGKWERAPPVAVSDAGDSTSPAHNQKWGLPLGEEPIGL
ncbi:hypothetical protein B0H11DRAFT_2188953 [Mycena galericulata]|nr:hypothetical protein B0H11DRAFT_2188953 [Mycena galericulata]